MFCISLCCRISSRFKRTRYKGEVLIRNMAKTAHVTDKQSKANILSKYFLSADDCMCRHIIICCRRVSSSPWHYLLQHLFRKTLSWLPTGPQCPSFILSRAALAALELDGPPYLQACEFSSGDRIYSCGMNYFLSLSL